jgi:IS30 family transposase
MRNYRRLTRADRYQIEKYLSANKSVSWIAKNLEFHRSAIYREINRGRIRQGGRGGKKKGEYSAREAHRRFKSTFYDARVGIDYRGSKIKGWVEDLIIIKIYEGWSPEQVAKRLWIEKRIKISTEGIYKYVLSMKARGSELYKNLRLYRRRKRRFKLIRTTYWKLQKKRRRSIEDRPGSANRRSRRGHWERDLMLGKRGGGGVLTIVDRKSRLTLLEILETTTASEANEKTKKALIESKQPCRSVTNDNGHEFGEFWELEKEINAKVFFAHPLSPWERGTVENTIGLLRQFIPKSSDLTNLSGQDLKILQHQINSRPRKSLGFKTPIEITTGRTQKLITQKRIEQPPPEYYEQFYLSAEEIEELRKYRLKNVALGG